MDENVQLYPFEDDGSIPNNQQLSVIVYEGVFKENPDEIEKTFNEHNWKNSWVDGVHDYHHYHSNTHEVLGVQSGSAMLQIGGAEGKMIEVHTGDVIVLPAGTGHRNMKSSEDFRIVGAYPEGAEYNLRTGEPGERPEVLEEIWHVSIPDTDPVYGKEGPLLSNWHVAK
ncbi:cupin domain-containing protein [Jeotgalibacillus sp. ET6]|uniref:cupin domain-containing protein n=1 Tax=Jeotgalibacillus sp. ET6 TaxID=3037260 RepID=UPI0024181E5B|nr:cupin domain-containing protein [Jeotgalibacillus sp. ET6]MDG5472683.1 cupin domain-containing protein [Jeotgalibacillus sp. ET6]